LFSYNGKTYKKYLGIEEGVKENECFVANEVIKPGEFTVSVFAENYITTNTVTVPVKQSGYTENIENQPATASVLEQMNTLLYNYANVCNDILKECQSIQRKLEEGNK
jgi:outer membrane receptor for ferrienterochelin and colicin